jgi:hypothetical protein
LALDPRLGGCQPVGLDAKLGLKPLDVGLQGRVVGFEGAMSAGFRTEFARCAQRCGPDAMIFASDHGWR